MMGVAENILNVKFNNKKELRQYFIRLLKDQKEDDRVSKSEVIGEKLFQLPEFRSCQKVLFYASFREEVITFPMMQQAIDQTKKIALPFVNTNNKHIVPMVVEDLSHLKTGAYGIKEPDNDPNNIIPVDELDAVIVPGLAFDHQGNRLGRGAGYYDRLLAQLPSSTLTIGLAFDCQYIDQLPLLQDHDIRVDCVLTNH